MNKKYIFTSLLLFSSLLFSSLTSYADTETGTLNVNATVAGKCRIKSIANVDFSTDYDPTSTTPNDSGQGNIVVKCTKGQSYYIYFNNPITGRIITDGTDNLDYEIYQDSNRTTVWPTSALAPYTSTSNADQQYEIYGRIPAEQDVGIGSYTGTQTATLEWTP